MTDRHMWLMPLTPFLAWAMSGCEISYSDQCDLDPHQCPSYVTEQCVTEIVDGGPVRDCVPVPGPSDD